MPFVPVSEVYRDQAYTLDQYLRFLEDFGNPAVIVTLIPGRCGSTYFSKLIEHTDACGTGNEIFNERTAEHWGSIGADFAQYLEAMARQEIRGGILWFQITPDRFRHLSKIVDDQVLGRWKYTAIVRRDIVLQALSYVYAVHSGIWHSNETSEKVVLKVPMDQVGEEVQQRVKAILQDERRIQGIFDKFPKQTEFIQYYEDIISNPQEEILRFYHFNGIQCDLQKILDVPMLTMQKIPKSGNVEIYQELIRQSSSLAHLLSVRKQNDQMLTLRYGKFANVAFPSPQAAAATPAPTKESFDPELTSQIDAAVELARAGHRDEARALASSLVAKAPASVPILHRAGVVMRLCGTPDQALAFFHRTLALSPNFYFAQVEIAGLHAELGQFEDALHWYYKAIGVAPNYSVAYMRAALLERRLGRTMRGVALLERAIAAGPSNREIRGTLAEFLVHQNRRKDAIAVYHKLLSEGQVQQADHIAYLALLNDAGEYRRVVEHSVAPAPARYSHPWQRISDLSANAKLALRYDRDAAIAQAAAIEAGPQWQSAARVSDTIAEAIASRRPLSMIRLGDVEARFMAYACPGLRDVLSGDELLAAGESAWRNWFTGNLRDAGMHAVARLQAQLVHSITQTDLLGLPTAARLQHAYPDLGYLEYLGEFIAEATHGRVDVAFTDALVNVELHRAMPFYSELLKNLDFLGVVSPHPDLAARLANHLGVREAAEYLIPPGTRFPNRPDPATGSSHLPERYDELLARLDVPRPGAVFLVGGGLLGKICAAHIKQRGGIALDIGSLADAWMGSDTHPGRFESDTTWALPALAERTPA